MATAETGIENVIQVSLPKKVPKVAPLFTITLSPTMRPVPLIDPIITGLPSGSLARRASTTSFTTNGPPTVLVAFAAVGAVEQQAHPAIRPLKLLYEIAAPGQRMLVIERRTRAAMIASVVEGICIIAGAGPGG